jgi:exosortase A
MAIPQTTDASAAWKRSGPATVLALVAVLLIFWPTTVFTVMFWETNGAYSHGYLIVPISIYLVWLHRTELARLTPRVQLWGLPLLLGVGILWALAYLIDVQLAMQLALFGALGAVIWTLLGTEVGRRLAFPYAYLLLAIPIWSLLIPILQEYTAIASTRTLRAFGVPVFLEAFYISIPSGQFVVEEVCAGLRYFLATLSIAALYAYLNYRRVSIGVVFVVAAMAISILMNWTRVVIIILAGHVTSMDHFLVRDHIAFGWVMFVVALVPMFLIGVWLQRFDKRPEEGESKLATAATRAPDTMQRLIAGTAAALVAVAVGPAMLHGATADGPVAEVRLEVPAATARWTVLDSTERYWGPRFVSPDGEVIATYTDGRARDSLYIAFYARQRDGAELINEVNAFYDEDLWKPRRESNRQVPLSDAETIEVREIELVSSAGQERLVWYWYRMADRRTTNPTVGKLWQLWNSLSGSPAGAAIVVSAARLESLDATRTNMEQFLSAMEPGIRAVIDAAVTS